MRYSSLRRKAFGEAFDFLNGRDMLRLLINVGMAEVRAGAAIGQHMNPYQNLSIGSEAVGALAGLTLAAGQVSVGMGIWAVAKMSRVLLAKMRRPKYYPQERSRRERLAKERRRVRDRFTTSPCPKPEELLMQYAKAGTGAIEALRFGSMLCDLEAYCDNSLLRNVDGEIVGRNPGIKGWLRENCPELLSHYKNAMRYKGLAEKFRQAAGAADPIPAAALLAEGAEATLQPLGGGKCGKITVRMKKKNGLRGGRTVSGTYALEADALESAWKCAREILGECGGEASTRLRCGEENGRGRGVTALERILEKRLGEMPAERFTQAGWRTMWRAKWRTGVGERASA
ncbi:MAG: hypothetical protein ILM98_15315 [Kiritimatiellae bacterium]|nr:hypothetical protein [Kiritimatiellia bacterium]